MYLKHNYIEMAGTKLPQLKKQIKLIEESIYDEITVTKINAEGVDYQRIKTNLIKKYCNIKKTSRWSNSGFLTHKHTYTATEEIQFIIYRLKKRTLSELIFIYYYILTHVRTSDLRNK